MDGSVRREYVGCGPLAEQIAQLDELRRLEKEEETRRFKDERERLEHTVTFLGELEEVTKTLTTAHLLAAGARRHNGVWRFKKT